MSPLRNRIALALAALALALNGLAPLAVLAAPTSVQFICTAEGAKQVPASPGDDSHAAKRCPLCVAGASPAAPCAAPASFSAAPPAATAPRYDVLVAAREVREHHARPRAPPFPR